MNELLKLLKQLPQRPGVYRMIGSLGNIIYVGKAKNLKIRVSQYFRSQKDRAPGISSATVTKLGKNENGSTEILQKLCIALECDICDIMEMEMAI